MFTHSTDPSARWSICVADLAVTVPGRRDRDPLRRPSRGEHDFRLHELGNPAVSIRELRQAPRPELTCTLELAKRPFEREVVSLEH